eukprot:234524-Rhodomonas_salina.4
MSKASTSTYTRAMWVTSNTRRPYQESVENFNDAIRLRKVCYSTHEMKKQRNTIFVPSVPGMHFLISFCYVSAYEQGRQGAAI